MNVWSSWIFENAVGENCSHFTERKKDHTKLRFLEFDDFNTPKSKNYTKKTTGVGPSRSKLGKDNPGFKQC